MKKITALALTVILLISTLLLTSCAGGEAVPDGMQLASIDGEPFKLYVPENMSLNLESGISSAFSYVPEKLVISARHFTPSESDFSLDAYMEKCSNEYADTLESFAITSLDACVIGGADAKKLIYTTKIDDINYTCTHISTVFKGDVISLYFYVPTASVENYKETVNSVTNEFLLCDKSEQINDEVTDKKTPAGMKIASADIVEYRLYVPTNWVCFSESGVSEAYFPESEKTNVTVTSYSPDESISTAEYVESCETTYAKTIKGYELISKEDTTVANRNAVSITFSATYNEIDYTINQTIFIYDEMIYSITYTAMSSVYDSHLDDLGSILSAFTFR